MNLFRMHFVALQMIQRAVCATAVTKAKIVMPFLLGAVLLLSSQLAVAQLDCAGAVVITPGVAYNGTTVGGQTKVSVYNGDPFWQSTGPEKVHLLNWPGGKANITLSNKSAELDLIVLSACDASKYQNGGAKSGINPSSITAALPAGNYYIVVDGWQLAAGTYTLLVKQIIEETIKIAGIDRTFRLENGSVSEIINGNPKLIASNVVSMGKYWGYVTDPNTGVGKEENVLAILKTGETKPKIFLNENFNTEYLRQKLVCAQKNLSLFGELVFDGNQQILSNCNVLRCENGYTLAHQRDGQIKLFQSSPNTWLDIHQIITIKGVSYYVRTSDNSVWVLDQNASAIKMIASNAKLLQDNDNQLIKIDLQGKYARWNAQQWSDLTPNYVGVSPEMIDEGFWFFVQAKPLLDQVGNVEVDQKMGLTFDPNGLLKMELIPATGDCERFLWRTKSLAGGKRLLINKAKGESAPLLIGAGGTPTFTAGSGSNEWLINVSDKNKYGTNAYQLFGSNSTKALSYENGVVSNSPQTGNKSQTWVFQFNQMVKNYFLPLPTKTILKTHLTANPNINVDIDADAILKDYNKFLKGDNDTYFFSTNTGSDWALVSYYFSINNILNAVVSPKPADPLVNPNLIKPISVLAGISMVLINKNDLSYSVTNHYFSLYPNDPYTAERVRGSGFYGYPKKPIFQSEELTCKTGIVNRPLDKSFRRFDHGVHEYAHALQDAALTNWDAIIDVNNMCNSEKSSTSSECGCYNIQNWFNSVGGTNTYPGFRAWDAGTGILMQKFFNKDNTWMPPKDLRFDGYNPSGPTLEGTPTDTEKPAITGCPVSQTVTLGSNGVKDPIPVIYPKATDNFGVTSSVLNLRFLDGATDVIGKTEYLGVFSATDISRNFNIKGVGRLVLEWIYKDAAGNTSTCASTITSVAATTGTCQMAIANGCVFPGLTTIIPVTVKGFNKIEAFELEFKIGGNTALSLESIINPVYPNLEFNKLANGNIKVQWVEASGQEVSLPDDTKLLEIVVKASAGFNTPGSISALNQVVVSSVTGNLIINANTMCVSTGVTPIGKILSASAKPQVNVKVDLTLGGTAVANVNTGTDGSYSFTTTPPTHRITPINDTDLKKGVTVADLSRIRRHNLQITLLTDPYALVAADINKNGVINVQDVSLLNRVLINLNTSFTGNTSWRFLPKGLDISSNPLKVDWPSYIDLSASGLDYSNLDFVAVKVGDVDHSAALQDDQVDNRSALTLTIPDTTVTPTNNMRIPVYISGPEGISAVSMTLKYKKDHVKLVRIDSTEMQNFGTGNYNDKDGTVLIAWDHPQGKDFKPTKPLMWLVFENVATTGKSTVEMSDVLLYDIDLNEIPVTSKNGSINFMNVSTEETFDGYTIRAFPNPFTDVLNVEVNLANKEQITLEITDATGKLLRTIESDKISSRHAIQVKDLDYSGIVFVKLRSKNINRTIRVIKI